MKYWLITYLAPNGVGCVHFTTRVSKISPFDYSLSTYQVIINAMEITELEYKRAVSQSSGLDNEIVETANYRIP